MPAKYEAMRDRFESQGMGEAAAKSKAARIYNGTRKQGEAPVTGNSDRGSSRVKREKLKKRNPFKGI